MKENCVLYLQQVSSVYETLDISRYVYSTEPPRILREGRMTFRMFTELSERKKDHDSFCKNK
jgi:hypothetical protein